MMLHEVCMEKEDEEEQQLKEAMGFRYFLEIKREEAELNNNINGTT